MMLRVLVLVQVPSVASFPPFPIPKHPLDRLHYPAQPPTVAESRPPTLFDIVE